MKLNFTIGLRVWIGLTVLLLIACKKKEKSRNILQAIQQTGQLVTVEYSLSKIVRASDNRTWYKLGDRKILISAEATVKAGVDLQNLTGEDVTIDGKQISLQLPPPTIFSVALPPEKITVQYEDVSFFRSRFSATEREALLTQAEKQIRGLADSLGVLQTARANAISFMEKLLRQSGYETINVRFKE